MIRELRVKLANDIDSQDGLPCPVYAYQPDDLNEVPCIVVDRPLVTVDVQHSVFTIAVVVIGRRDGTEDAQAELDDLAAWTARVIAGPEFAVQSIAPSIRNVADLVYPTYDITVACGVTYCEEGRKP